MRRRIGGLLRRLAAARRAAAAVEFAVIVPMLMVLYLGASEIALATTMNRKLQNVASTTADLVGQLTSTTPEEIAAILQITRALVEPYASTDVKIVMSSVSVDDKGKATVDWSEATTNATARVRAAPFTLPTAFADQVSRSFVIAEVDYTYQPLGGSVLPANLRMRQVSYLTPRNAPTVACSAC